MEGHHLLTLDSLRPVSDGFMTTKPVRYGYRSFDRHFAYPDSRLCDRPRPQLWDSYSSSQLYFATLTSTFLSDGPALTVSPYVPDLDFFKNRGAKDIHPLYRDFTAQEPNISASLLQLLSKTYKKNITAETVAHYVFGILGTGAYTQQFMEELAESPARVPFTNDEKLFTRVATFGEELIYEQTWGERCTGQLNQFGQPTRTRFQGQATIKTPVPPSDYPENWEYSTDTRELRVGHGIFAHVSPEVMNFNVSGMNVVSSWLGYRMKSPSGKSSSPLDRIQADTWELDRELLELLWQIEYFIEAETRAEPLLNEVLRGKLIPVKKFQAPTALEQKEPAKKKKQEDTIF